MHGSPPPIEEDIGNNATPPPSVIDLSSEGTTSYIDDSGAVEEVASSPKRSNAHMMIQRQYDEDTTIN
jgi:hypothetical protein